jgi:hypothetical protein
MSESRATRVKRASSNAGDLQAEPLRRRHPGELRQVPPEEQRAPQRRSDDALVIFFHPPEQALEVFGHQRPVAGMGEGLDALDVQVVERRSRVGFTYTAPQAVQRTNRTPAR